MHIARDMVDVCLLPPGKDEVPKDIDQGRTIKRQEGLLRPETPFLAIAKLFKYFFNAEKGRGWLPEQKT